MRSTPIPVKRQEANGAEGWVCDGVFMIFFLIERHPYSKLTPLYTSRKALNSVVRMSRIAYLISSGFFVLADPQDATQDESDSPKFQPIQALIEEQNSHHQREERRQKRERNEANLNGFVSSARTRGQKPEPYLPGSVPSASK